jgi:hypothetical protein
VRSVDLRSGAVLPLVRADARERDITAATIRGACRYLAAVRVIPSPIGARVAIEGAIAGPIYWRPEDWAGFRRSGGAKESASSRSFRLFDGIQRGRLSSCGNPREILVTLISGAAMGLSPPRSPTTAFYPEFNGLVALRKGRRTSGTGSNRRLRLDFRQQM